MEAKMQDEKEIDRDEIHQEIREKTDEEFKMGRDVINQKP
jgi:hypothetical protein